jgi:hypothetical protein
VVELDESSSEYEVVELVVLEVLEVLELSESSSPYPLIVIVILAYSRAAETIDLKSNSAYSSY